MGGAERLIALPFLFLRPVPLPQLPPTKVWREGKAERLSCCRLGPLLPPGMTRNRSTSSASSRLCPETQTTTPRPSQLHRSADGGGSGAAQTSARRRVPFTQQQQRATLQPPPPTPAAAAAAAAEPGVPPQPWQQQAPCYPGGRPGSGSPPRGKTRLAPTHPASTHQGQTGGCSHLPSRATLQGVGVQQLPGEQWGGRKGGGGRT